MNVRRFRALHAAGATYADIARECGCDWRTVRKYLADEVSVTPPAAPSRAGTQPRVLAPYYGVIEAWLRADPWLRGSVIHERLVAEHGFTGSYQRVKMHLAEVRPGIAAEVSGGEVGAGAGRLHRRFEVIAGAQAQVDWGEEGDVLGHVGIPGVYSFHMTLSWSRDPFCCFTTSMDLATFWDCHRRAFAHFGGVPATIVYDRTKTVVKRHVAPGVAVPLHPQAAAFAEHYGFGIDVLAAYRPTGKGRVERQVLIVREHVLAGRCFDSVAELDGAFTAWVPIRRRQVHRTHGQVIGVRAERDRAALGPLPETPYLVADRHLRRVGKDALVSFEASLYSVPAERVRPGQRVAICLEGGSSAQAGTLTIRALDAEGGSWLATHPRATQRGSWVVDPAHWAGLPDGHTRATTRDDAAPLPVPASAPEQRDREDGPGPLAALLVAHHSAGLPVTVRPLSVYQDAAGAPATIDNRS